jgi:hypothetical protein
MELFFPNGVYNIARIEAEETTSPHKSRLDNSRWQAVNVILKTKKEH